MDAPGDNPIHRDLKTCKDCGEAKDRSDFYVSDKKTGALMPRCKPCHCKMTGANSARRYAEDPEKYRLASRQYAAANRETVNEKQVARRAANPEAARARERELDAQPHRKAAKAEYRKKNAERRKASAAEYRRINREAIQAKNTEYRLQHPEIYRDAARKWQAANPAEAAATRRIARHKRRALLANVEGSFTEAEWQAIKAAQDFTCLLCRKREPEITLTVDHIIPLSKGGTNHAGNICGLCGWCNSHKKDRILPLDGIAGADPDPGRQSSLFPD